MIRAYQLKGLSKPSSATLLDEKSDEFFNAKFEGENFDGLWKYCENHWQETNLLAMVKFEKYDGHGIPVNPVVFKVMPKEESKVLTAHDGIDF